MVLGWFLAVSAGPETGTIQAQDAKTIVERADALMNGRASKAVIELTVVRPDWTRTTTMKSWALGRDYALIVITDPARDRGTAFLKRGREVWNWQPAISRTIKLPPSMMSQNWMGSDLTNDDLVRQSSLVTDYIAALEGTESMDGRTCWKLRLMPLPDAPVVWGRVDLWIERETDIQMKATFFDEDMEPVHTLFGRDIGPLGGRILARTLEVVPADKPGQLTRFTYRELTFDPPLDATFFSLQQLRNVQ